jgi:hypothetical protein
MTYQLRDLLNTEAVIAQSDEIADLWQAIDQQHFMIKRCLVVTKGDEVVAGEATLLDKMIAAQTYNIHEVAAL